MDDSNSIKSFEKLSNEQSKKLSNEQSKKLSNEQSKKLSNEQSKKLSNEQSKKLSNRNRNGNGNAIEQFHSDRDEFVDKLEQRQEETGRDLYIRPTKSSSAKLPLPVLFDNKNAKINARSSAVWVLNALGNLTPKEYNEFTQKNKDKLTINELVACKLLEETQQNDPKATERFWGIQRDFLKSQSKNIVSSDTVVSDSSIIANVMDRVKYNFVKNQENIAKTAEIVDVTEVETDENK